MNGAVSAVTVVELEALYLRMALGETSQDDVNMLKAIMQGLVGTIRRYEEVLGIKEEAV